MEGLAQAAPISEVDSQQVDDPMGLGFIWTIENLFSLTTKTHSDVFVAGGYEWRLIVFPNGNDVLNHLSIYLEVADSEYLPSGWSRYACFCISVVNQADNNYTISNDTEHEFNAGEDDWGFASFMPLDELHDPSNGFIVNDSIVIGVVVAFSPAFSFGPQKSVGNELNDLTISEDPEPSSDAHTTAASLGVTIPSDDELNDLNFSDEEPSHTPDAPDAKSLDDLPILSKKVEAARDLILSIHNKKSLYTIAEDLELFTDALNTIKAAVPPAHAERVEKMLKVLSESAHQLEIANKQFHEAKEIIDKHEDLEVAVKTDIDEAKQMKLDQQVITKYANELVSDIEAKEAELAKLKQELSAMGDIKKGNEAVRKAYVDCLNKKGALKVQSAKVADAEAKKKFAGEEANRVLQEWEDYVQDNVEFI